MLLNILLSIEIIVSLALVGVVLLQRSEGGALGMGGGPSGFMTTRGAGDLLTRTTWILAALFFGLALLLTVLAARERGASSVLDRVKVDAVDPKTLSEPVPAATPERQAPAPLSAPTPSINNPFLGGATQEPAKK